MGNPPEFPSLVGIASRRNADEVGDVVCDGRGRMPGSAHLSGPVQRAIVRYVVDGTSQVVSAAAPTPFDLPYTLDGYWQVPLGEVPGSGVANSGSENYGGPVVTASGVLFIGATNYDSTFRAFDAANGALLWEAKLPAAGNATPAVYAVGGKQYVVIAAGGGKWGAPSGGSYVAFALP